MSRYERAIKSTKQGVILTEGKPRQVSVAPSTMPYPNLERFQATKGLFNPAGSTERLDNQLSGLLTSLNRTNKFCLPSPVGVSRSTRFKLSVPGYTMTCAPSAISLRFSGKFKSAVISMRYTP